MIMMKNLVTICHHRKILQYHWLYSPAVYFIPVTLLFCNWKLAPLNLPLCFTHSPTPSPLWQPPVCSLYLWICFCFIIFVHLACFSDFTYKWNHMIFVFLWVISLGIIPSRFIHVVTNGKISFFLWLNNIHVYIYV